MEIIEVRSKDQNYAEIQYLMEKFITWLIGKTMDRYHFNYSNLGFMNDCRTALKEYCLKLFNNFIMIFYLYTQNSLPKLK